jgi:hypothetical protein
MEKITQEAINDLLTKATNSLAVTIYLPTHGSASPPHMTEDQIRLKNLVQQAAEMLGSKGEAGSRLARQLSDYQQELLNDRSFWESQASGVLICIGQDITRAFRLPIDTEEYVSVDNTFFLAPILGLRNDQQEYYVLYVAQKEPALLKGDMYGLYRTTIELPKSLIDALNIDEPNQKSEQAQSARGSSLNTSWHNGRGGAKDPASEDRARFLRMIDDIVYHATDHKLPLILAGVEDEVVEYRHLSKYPKILNGIIPGGHRGLNMNKLFTPAASIVKQEVIDSMHKEVLEDYSYTRGANPDRAADSEQAIAEAANEGRVDTLLMQFNTYTTDTIQDSRNARDRITFPDSKLAKLINELAVKVWSMSGRVINFNTRLPGNRLVAARLRY